MTIEGITAHLSISDDFNTRIFLEGDAFFYGAVLYNLECSRADLARFKLLACFYQIGGPKQAAHHFTVVCHAENNLPIELSKYEHTTFT